VQSFIPTAAVHRKI